MKKLILPLLIALSFVSCNKDSDEHIDPSLLDDFYRLESDDRTFFLNGDATYLDYSIGNDTMIALLFKGGNNSGFGSLINKTGEVWDRNDYTIFMGDPDLGGPHLAGMSFTVNSNTNYAATEGVVRITSKKKGDYIAGNINITLWNVQKNTYRKVTGSFKASADSKK